MKKKDIPTVTYVPKQCASRRLGPFLSSPAYIVTHRSYIRLETRVSVPRPSFRVLKVVVCSVMVIVPFRITRPSFRVLKVVVCVVVCVVMASLFPVPYTSVTVV